MNDKATFSPDGDNREPLAQCPKNQGEPNGITIRHATSADHAVLVEHTIAHAQEIEKQKLEHATVVRGIAHLLNDPEAVLLVACASDGQVVGSCLMGGWEWSERRAGWFWWVTSVFVSEPHRRVGIKSALYQELLRLARAVGVVGLRSYVRRGNKPSFKSHRKMRFKRAPYVLIERDLA